MLNPSLHEASAVGREGLGRERVWAGLFLTLYWGPVLQTARRLIRGVWATRGHVGHAGYPGYAAYTEHAGNVRGGDGGGRGGSGAHGSSDSEEDCGN